MQEDKGLWKTVRIVSSLGVVIALLMALSIFVGELLTGFSNYMSGFDSGNYGKNVYSAGDTPVQAGVIYILSVAGYLVSSKILGSSSRHLLGYALGLSAPGAIILSIFGLGIDPGTALVIALILGIAGAVANFTANADRKRQFAQSPGNNN